MRIISGKYRNRILTAPKGLETRPSTDRVRESIINMVVSRIQLFDAQVLDLFAGTGALGLEAISRGASKATFVELNGKVTAHTKKNVDSLGLDAQCQILKANAMTFLKQAGGRKYDLIFADPPYELEGLTEIPELALGMLNEFGILVLEHDKRHNFKSHPFLDTSRPYGRTTVSIFSHKTSSTSSSSSGKETASKKP